MLFQSKWYHKISTKCLRSLGQFQLRFSYFHYYAYTEMTEVMQFGRYYKYFKCVKQMKIWTPKPYLVQGLNYVCVYTLS